MVSPLWLIPLAVLVAALWPMLIATRRVVDEVTAMRDSLHALGEIRPALAVVEEEARARRRALENLPLR